MLCSRQATALLEQQEGLDTIPPLTLGVSVTWFYGSGLLGRWRCPGCGRDTVTLLGTAALCGSKSGVVVVGGVVYGCPVPQPRCSLALPPGGSQVVSGSLRLGRHDLLGVTLWFWETRAYSLLWHVSTPKEGTFPTCIKMRLSWGRQGHVWDRKGKGICAFLFILCLLSVCPSVCQSFCLTKTHTHTHTQRKTTFSDVSFQVDQKEMLPLNNMGRPPLPPTFLSLLTLSPYPCPDFDSFVLEHLQA